MDSVCLAAVCLLEVCLLMFVTDYTMHLLDNVKKIHFIGCGGSGMYPLIQILSAKGMISPAAMCWTAALSARSGRWA